MTGDGSGGPGGTGETGAVSEPGTGGRCVDVAPDRIVRWAETNTTSASTIAMIPAMTVIITECVVA